MLCFRQSFELSDSSATESDVDTETADTERQELTAFDETYQRIFKDMIPKCTELELMEAFRWLEKVCIALHINVSNGC